MGCGPMPWLLQWEDELGKLDQLLALLAAARRRWSPKSLRITFSARSHVWGAMPAECEFDRQRRIARQ
jgi:hypothetical protein